MRRESQLQREIKQRRPFRSAAQEAVIGLLRTADVARQRLADALAPSGLTLQQYNVLRILRGASDQGLPTLEIAGRMIERAPGITRLLDRLEAKSLVRRVRCPEDRRQVLCWPTAEALDLLASLDDLADLTDRSIVGNLQNQDLEELIRLLDHLRQDRESAG
jgi:DNA-binding MarR family transcriptional regulator